MIVHIPSLHFRDKSTLILRHNAHRGCLQNLFPTVCFILHGQIETNTLLATS